MHFVLQDITLLRPTSGKLKFIYIIFIVIYLFYFIFTVQKIKVLSSD